MPFKYDLNQIPYDYTVEVMNKLKGLDLVYQKKKKKNLVDRVPEKLWTELTLYSSQ